LNTFHAKETIMAIWTLILCSALATADDEAVIKVDAAIVRHKVSPFLYGACIEDVNHEIYGGLYSQMIFGESFQEPPRPVPLRGFTAYGGEWVAKDGELRAAAGDGPKLIADVPPFAVGIVAVEIMLPGTQGGNSGLILDVAEPGKGADAFIGYEVSLETSGKLVLGRHRKNWEPLRTIACAVPPDRWISLVVKLKGNSLEILVDGELKLIYEDTEHPLDDGRVGLRTWQRPAAYRNLMVTLGGMTRKVPFEPKESDSPEHHVSGMWAPIQRGTAKGGFAIDTREPFVGRQGQKIALLGGGDGEVGIENRGLNRQGISFVAAKPYEGYLWVRASEPTNLAVVIEQKDGRAVAETRIPVKGDAWKRYDFVLAPNADVALGQFAIKTRGPGEVTIGHAFLQPGEWGRFNGLPDRKDVVDALIAQGITMLRYGGSMVNHPEYRWKNMIGPRDRRPPTGGLWYPYSSNGWGIFDFLNVCEAAGFLAIPAVHMGETPQDMADFVEYVNGPADSPWGRKRAADGHPAPYRLKHVELGNEEAVNEDYWAKFRPMAEAMWAKDPALILIVGDFAYNRVITDPFKFEGGVAANTLAAHKKILDLAKELGREVWFDIHVSTDHPPEPNGLKPERSYIEQLGKISPGAKYKVVIFEYNSGNHAMKRALSNALATNEAERIGDLLPIACSANCLQVDKQNDNAWDQGLLFLNPAKVWLQPPGYALKMMRTAREPLLVRSEVAGRSEKLSVNAKRSEDGKSLVLQIVNWDDSPRPVRYEIAGFTPSKPAATVETLSGPLEGVNPADAPDRITPTRSEWRHDLRGGRATQTVAPRSITIIRFE
jgi:alpha-L-arabinofuranosidase